MGIANGYISLLELKAALGIAASDGADDTLLEASITAVSRAIDDYCRRRFYAATETRYYTATCASRLLIDDLLVLNTLKTDEDGDRTYERSWVVSGAARDVDLEPANNALDERPYWELRVTPEGDYAFPVGVARGVEVSGSFGFSFGTPAAAPAAVRQACLFQSELDFRAKDAPMGSSGGGDFAQAIQGAGLHPFARRLLDPYCRLAVA